MTDDIQDGGLDRRSVLRRGAILGGAMVWTVPTVQSIAGAAYAAGTTCTAEITYNYTERGTSYCVNVKYIPDDPCCGCLASNGAATNLPIALGICAANGSCKLAPNSPSAC